MKPIIFLLTLLLTQGVFSQEKALIDSKKIESGVKVLLNEGENQKAKRDYVAAYKSFSKASSLATSLDSGNYYFLKTEEALAMWLHDVGFIKEAIQRQLLLLSIIEKQKHSTDISFEIGLRGSFAGWYIEAGDYENALVQYKRNIELSGFKDASQHNNLGWFYLQVKEYDSAYVHFKIAESDIKKNNTNHDFHYSIYDNLGDLFMARRQYDSALYYINKCASLLKNNKLEPHRPLQLHYKFARNYFLDRQFDKALAELIVLDKLLKTKSGDKRDYDLKAAELWYELMEAQGKKAEALNYYKKFVQIKDRVRNAKDLAHQDVINMMVEQNLSQINLQLKYEQGLRERNEQDLKLSEAKRKFNWYFAMWIAFLSIVIIVSAQIIYKNRSRKAKAIAEKLEISNRLKEVEIQVKELEQDKLEALLEGKRKDISEMSLLVQGLRKLQSDLSLKVRDIKKISPAERENELKKVISEIHHSIENSQRASHLQEYIEDVNQEFYGKLNEEHPELTKAEIEMCALIRVNIKSNEIASIKNMALTSVKQSKRRLRRKLGLEESADLYDYLKRF